MQLKKRGLINKKQIKKKKNNKQGGKMFEERMKQLKAEQQNLNMRMAEINFLIQGYETAIKEKEKAESDKKEDK